MYMKYLSIAMALAILIAGTGCKALNGSLTVKHDSGAEIKVSDEGLEVTLPESKCIEVDSFGACVEITAGQEVTESREVPVTEDK